MTLMGLASQLAVPPADAAQAAALKLARASIEALALKAGQVLDAKVLGTLANGLTQLSIGAETLAVQLSPPLPAGTLLRLEVQPGGANGPTLLATLPQAAPAQAAAPAPLPANAQALPLPEAQTGPAAAPPAAAVPSAPARAQSPAPVPAAIVPVAMAAGSPPPLPVAATPAPQPAAIAPTPSPAPVIASPAAAPAPAAAPPQTAAPAASAPPAGMPVPPAAATPVPVAPPAAAAVVTATPASLAPLAPPAAAAPPVPVTAPAAGQPPATPAPQPAAPLPGPSAPVPATSSTAPPPAPVPTGLAPAPSAGQQAPAASPAPLPPPAAVPAPPQGPAQPPLPQTSIAMPPAPAGAPPYAAPPAPPPATLPPAAPAAQATAATPRPAALPVPPQASPLPPAGPAAQAVLAQATQAAARQDSAAPLLQNLAVLSGRMAELPRPVAEAAARLLSGRISLERGAPAAQTLRDAVLRSGVFLEALSKPGAPQPPAPGDAKAALQALRNALSAWLGPEVSPVHPVGRRPPPPTRGAEPRGMRSETPTLAENVPPKEAGRTLFSQAEAALSRLRLMQLSSLPADAARAMPTPAAAEWNLELPMLLGHELAMMQMRIQRDGGGRGEKRERGWRMAFSLDFPALGEVGAQVSLFGRSASVTIWAAEAETAAALEAMLPELTPALMAKGLTVGAVRVRHGQPVRREAQVGQLMDSVR